MVANFAFFQVHISSSLVSKALTVATTQIYSHTFGATALMPSYMFGIWFGLSGSSWTTSVYSESLSVLFQLSLDLWLQSSFASVCYSLSYQFSCQTLDKYMANYGQ